MNKIKGLGFILMIPVFFISGCGGGNSSATMSDDLRHPVKINETSVPMPTISHSAYDMDTFRVIQPIMRRTVTFLGYQKDLMNSRSKPIDYDSVIDNLTKDIIEAEKEAYDASVYIQGLTPPNASIAQRQQHTVELLTKYRASLSEAKENVQNPKTINKSLAKIVLSLQAMSGEIKIGTER